MVATRFAEKELLWDERRRTYISVVPGTTTRAPLKWIWIVMIGNKKVAVAKTKKRAIKIARRIRRGKRR